VGIYWQDEGIKGLPDWDAKGYRTPVVKDPSGTIILVEEPNIQNVVGNIWPCISIGPKGTGDLYQTDPGPDAKNLGTMNTGSIANALIIFFMITTSRRSGSSKLSAREH